MNKSMLSLLISFSTISIYSGNSATKSLNTSFYNTIDNSHLIDQHNNHSSIYEDVCSGNVEKVKLLISTGVNINIQDQWGNTLLHIAVYNGYTQIVNILINAGTNANIQNNDGNTPLHISVLKNKFAITLILIRNCNDLQCYTSIHAINNDGKTPQQIAESQGYNNLAKILKIYKK